MSKYTLVLDASQMKQFGICNLSWAYQYREHLMWAEANVEAMDKGTLVHLLLEKYYKLRLKEPNFDIYTSASLAIQEYQESELVKTSYFPIDVHQHICKRFVQYVGYWAGRDIRPVTKNSVAGVELGFSKILLETSEVLFVVEGKIDLIMDIGDGQIGIVDHKSQDRDARYYYYRPQMLTYAWATDAAYGMINYFGLQKEYKEKVSFRRDTMQFPKWMISRWEKQMIEIFYEIACRDKQLKDKINEDKFKRNFSSCAGAFETHPCMFSHLCESESQETREALKRNKYKTLEPWSPWK